MNRVFLDVDGVLTDFGAGVHRALGIDYDPHQWPYTQGPEGWQFYKEIGLTTAQLGELCTFEFWKNLPWYYDSRSILQVVRKFFANEQIALLTSPALNVMGPSGRIAWIEANLPEFKHQTLICSGKKHILAGVPGSLLIDDCQRNVDIWREAGGKAILVPRPWNNLYTDAENAPAVIRENLEQFALGERAASYLQGGAAKCPVF